MSRPRKNGLEYFPHDVNASSDLKIEALEAKFGLEGYAVYFKLLERIYRDGRGLSLKDEDDLIVLARKIHIPPERLKTIIDFAVQKLLFVKPTWMRHKTLIAHRIKKTLEPINDKRAKWREKKGNKDKEFSQRKTRGKLGENSTKESKVKERKEKNINTIPPIPPKGEEMPVWVPKEEWEGFVAMRKKIKAPLTDHAVKLAFSELERLRAAGQDPGEVLNQSTMKGWRGLFAIKPGALNEANKPNNQTSRSQAGGIRAAPGKYDSVPTIKFGEGEEGDTGG